MATYNNKFLIKNGLAVGGSSGPISVIDENGNWVGATGILTGASGVSGASGSTGIDGASGSTGITGASGVDGLQGASGASGSTGLTGSTGITGASGSTGITGASGVQGASGSTGITGASGVQGASGLIGSTGVQGPQGNFGGATFDYTFDTTITASDPGTGNIRFNNATLSSATAMYIDASNDASTDISTFLNTIDDSTSTIKGHFRISKKADASAFALYTITSLTNNTGWFTVNASYVSGNSTFANLDDIIITFARTGDKGDTGLTGATGIQGIQGASGSTGLTGSTGSTGPTGTQGASGSTGLQGASGNQGASGSTGAVGYQGASGSTGLSGSTGPGIIWNRVTSNTTALVSNQYIADTTGGAFTLTLPATPSLGNSVVVADGGNWHTNNLTIARNGSTIEGSASDFILDIDSILVRFVFDGTTWQAYVSIGAMGASGPAGASGATGYQGASGSTGIQGASGSTGIAGSTGVFGASGLTGLTGATGIQGIQGASGSTGLSGATGIQGASGSTGATGSAGINGASGATGSAGINGASGSVGATGSAGPSTVINATATTTSQTSYIVGVNAAGSNQTPYVSTTSPISFNPNTGVLSDSKGDVRAAPINNQAGNYVAVAADAGKTIVASLSGATITINTSIFNPGDMITVINTSAGNITIVQGTSVTLRLASTTTTGTRTLSTLGMATLVCTIGSSAPTFFCSGAGLT